MATLLQATVVGNSLYLFGGTIEIGDKEITLDDMWSLDLAKLDGCVCCPCTGNAFSCTCACRADMCVFAKGWLAVRLPPPR